MFVPEELPFAVFDLRQLLGVLFPNGLHHFFPAYRLLSAVGQGSFFLWAVLPDIFRGPSLMLVDALHGQTVV